MWGIGICCAVEDAPTAEVITNSTSDETLAKPAGYDFEKEEQPEKQPEKQPEQQPEQVEEDPPEDPHKIFVDEGHFPEVNVMPGVQNAVVWHWIWSNTTQRDHSSLGVELGGKRHVVIKAVKTAGLAQTWNQDNKKTPGKHPIVKGSVIVGVNEVLDHGYSTGIIRTALRSSPDLDIKMRYVPYFELTTAVEDLGVESKELDNGEIEIEFVNYEGAIPEHNRRCDAGFEIAAGDRILSVSPGSPRSGTKTIRVQKVAHLEEESRSPR